MKEIENLTNTQYQYFSLRFSTDGSVKLTFQQIADRMNFSRQRAWQLEQEILRKLNGRIDKKLKI